MARLLVGLPALKGDLTKYQARFDMVEVRPIDTSLPRVSTLRKWRKSVPPAFVFSVVLPRVVGELMPSAELDDALAKSLDVAAALEARCVVIATPATVRPTATNKKRLAALIERIPQDGIVRCWEPAGIWEREEVITTARELSVVPVLDAAREQLGAGSVAYTRIRALGKSTALSAATVERVADRLRRRREAYVVVEGVGEAQRVRTTLNAELSKRKLSGSGVTVVRPIMPTLIAEDEEQ